MPRSFCWPVRDKQPVVLVTDSTAGEAAGQPGLVIGQKLEVFQSTASKLNEVVFLNCITTRRSFYICSRDD